ncbi:MAG: FtsX-like permease family protein [Arachnia sp.]
MPRPGGLLTWARRWRPALGYAWRDLRDHRLRTVMAALLIALPVAAIVTNSTVTNHAAKQSSVALQRLPQGAQAEVTATALPEGPPFQQLPEGAPGPYRNDFDQVPATKDQLAGLLPEADSLAQYWDSSSLLITTSSPLSPGDQAAAGAATAEDLGYESLTTTTLTEAEPAAVEPLMPKLLSGSAPATAADLVLSQALADRLGVAVGDNVTLIAPPFGGWYSETTGRLPEIIQDLQRGYRVSGIADSAEQRAWATAGWLSGLLEADPAGTDRHWLVLGDEPVTWEQAQAANRLQAFVVSRHVLEHYPAAHELYPVTPPPDQILTTLIFTTIGTLVALSLLLLLITPAFAVATEQSRRRFAIAAAAGATPRDLLRMVTTTGLITGLCGGGLGIILALGASAAFLLLTGYPLGAMSGFPVPLAAGLVALAAAVGVVGTVPPARQVARLDLTAALKDRIPPHRHHKRRGRVWGWLGLALTGVGILVGIASLQVPIVVADPVTDLEVVEGPAIPMLPLRLMVAAYCLIIVGGLLALQAFTPVLLRWLSDRGTLASKLAHRDAAEHPTRYLPAATAITVAVAIASAQLVMLGSGADNQRNTTGTVAAAGRLALGPGIPLSDDFDAELLAGVVADLARSFPVTGHIPVSDIDFDEQPELLLPEGQSCPAGEIPDTRSAIDPEAPLVCAPFGYGFSPSMTGPWWQSGTEFAVMNGDALRASGLPGADAAATTLEAGGIVINNAAYLDRHNQVRLLLAAGPQAGQTVQLPGAFVRGYDFYGVISPDTAADLGITPQPLGAYVELATPLSPTQQIQVAGYLADRWGTHPEGGLVAVSWVPAALPWGEPADLITLAPLVALAVIAAAASLMLAKRQTLRQETTMAIVGAGPGFLRRFAVAQAGSLLMVGVPLGIIAGVGLGAYQVAWRRRVPSYGAGPWLETVPLWGSQLALGGLVAAATIIIAVAAARPARALSTRRAE